MGFCEWPMSIGARHVPFGYARGPERGQLVVVEEAAETVRLIYRLYRRGWSDRAIARHLSGLGLPNAQGNIQWSATSVSRILQNPVYAGLVRHKGGLHEGDHEPILRRRVWAAAQELRRHQRVLGHC